MKIANHTISLKQLIFLLLYYSIIRYLPNNNTPLIGKWMKEVRAICCKNIFLETGKNINVWRLAYFGFGNEIRIGDNSDLGYNCVVPDNIIIGTDVMMGPNCRIYGFNHEYENMIIPMNKQGRKNKLITIIEDDIWIGGDVVFTPGRNVKNGSIIGARCLLCKDFPEYSVI